MSGRPPSAAYAYQSIQMLIPTSRAQSTLAAAVAAAAGVALLFCHSAFAQPPAPPGQTEPAAPAPAPGTPEQPAPEQPTPPLDAGPPAHPAPGVEPVPADPPSPAPPSPAPFPTVDDSSARREGDRSDHVGVVGRWGVEGRRLAAFERTPGQERGCEADCPIVLSSFGVRHWTSPRFAWSAGLAFSIGGGSAMQMGETRTWDTHLGGGPTAGVSFLLAEARHLAVSAGPQLDLIAFMPSDSGSKSILVNLRALVEAELHFGFIGFPDASVSASGGLQASLLKATRDERGPTEGATRSKWGADLFAPQAPWDLITRTQLRYYF